MTFLLILANIAIVAVLIGIAHFVNWAGPSYGVGVLTGMMVFATWIRITDGRWP